MIILGDIYIGTFTLDLLKVEALSNWFKVNCFNVFTLVYFKAFPPQRV